MIHNHGLYICNFCNTGEVCTGDPGSDWSGVVHLYSYEGGLPSGVPSVLHHSGKKQSHRNTMKYGYMHRNLYYEFMFKVNLVYSPTPNLKI